MRLAILGCAAIAQWHVDAAASVSGVEIVCTFDVVPELSTREKTALLVGEADGNYRLAFIPQLRAFAAAVDGGQPLAAPAEEALRDLAVIETAYRSLRGSSWERVKPVDGPTTLAVT